MNVGESLLSKPWSRTWRRPPISLITRLRPSRSGPAFMIQRTTPTRPTPRRRWRGGTTSGTPFRSSKSISVREDGRGLFRHNETPPAGAASCSYQEVQMNVRYRVTLTQYERDELGALLSGGKHSARKLKRAQILLAADAGATDEEIANTVGVG